MKKLIIKTKTYIGPLYKGKLDFYVIYKNQLFILSKEKFNYLINYLKISFPDTISTNYNLSSWFYKKKLLNENLLNEISSRIINIPNDFSESDVYYHLCKSNKRKTIKNLFIQTLQNAYVYEFLENNKEKFIYEITNFYEKNIDNLGIEKTIDKFILYFYSQNNDIFQKIQKIKDISIILKDNFFFERTYRFKPVINNKKVLNYVFFPKRQILEFLFNNNFDINIDKLLKIIEKINHKKQSIEKNIYKKNFSNYHNDKQIFRYYKNCNFSFLDIKLIFYLILLDRDIKQNNKFCKHDSIKELVTYLSNTQFYFILNNILFESSNYAKAELKF